MSHLARPITKDEVAAYRHAGVVLLRGILSLSAVNALRRSIDQAVRTIPQSPSGYDLSFLTRSAEEIISSIKKTASGQTKYSVNFFHVRVRVYARDFQAFRSRPQCQRH